jgi:DNA-binding response OmpR family regulator
MPTGWTSTQFAIDQRRRVPRPARGYDPTGKAPYLGTRILILEDEMMIAWTIENMLSEAGYSDITIAADGYEGRRASAERTPGLLVSDINLGAGIDGIETCVTICKAANIPVLFVTAYADERTRDRIANHFPHAELLRKPIDGGMLIGAVQRALAPQSNH